MTFRPAALAAAIGTALVSLAYLINNIIPIALNLRLVAPLDAAVVLLTTLVPGVTWTIFFLACWQARAPCPAPRVAWVTLTLAVLLPGLYQAFQRLPYFSVLSVDSATYLLNGILLPLAWTILLVRVVRFPGAPLGPIAPVLLLLTALAGAPELLSSGNALVNALGGTLSTFWDYNASEALWRLVISPAIRVVYWSSQIFFLIALRKA